MRRTVSLLAVAACAAAFSLPACTKEEEAAAPPKVETPQPPAPEPIVVSHVLVAIKGKAALGERTRDEAKVWARDLLLWYRAGRMTWDEIVDKYSDDRRSREAKANSDRGLPPGSYRLVPGQMVREFEEAGKKTPVGGVYPEPVETQYGFHLIRREK